MRILVLFVFGALLAACSGSTRVEDILRANTPTPPRKSHLENRSPPEAETRTAPEAEPQEALKSTVQRLSEE